MGEWRPIETAPKDGTIIDVWFANKIDNADLKFYCTKGTRRSPAWHYRQGKFRPYLPGGQVITTFVQPTHWMPLPDPPKDDEVKEHWSEKSEMWRRYP